jgi:outer membrane protein insertion porin family
MPSWITAAGDLNQDILNQDSAKLTAFCNNGYIRARVGEPQVEFEEDGIVVTFKINEGPRFKLGKVDFNGDLILPKGELMKKLKMTKSPSITGGPADRCAGADRLIQRRGLCLRRRFPKWTRTMKSFWPILRFKSTRASRCIFERIQISGNTKTRDKVIRRELRVYEQELYSGVRLKRGSQSEPVGLF